MTLLSLRKLPVFLLLPVALAATACSSGGGAEDVKDGVVQDASDTAGGDTVPGDADDAVEVVQDTQEETVEEVVVAPPDVPYNGFRVVFFDVGQGDAILIEAGTGETMLIDGGKSDSVLKDRLQHLGIDHLDTIVVTHPDADHVGGLVGALALFNVANIYWNGTAKDTDVFAEFLTAAMDEEAPIGVLKRGDGIPLGGFQANVLNPGSPLTGYSNDDSIVLSIGCPGSMVLLTGDAEVWAEGDMDKAGMLEDVDVLKVSHHGAASATSDAFLAAVSPEVGILSVGQKNSYGHPAAVTVDKLKAAGVELWTTDTTDGDDSIEFVTDCENPYVIKRLYE
ncbi:MAG: ComEC/Rec2 family competence protein [Myxococcota bacterium]